MISEMKCKQWIKNKKDNNNSLNFYDYEKVHLFSVWLYT